MTRPKANRRQHGRKSWSKQPAFVVVPDDEHTKKRKRLSDFLQHFDDTGIVPRRPQSNEEMMALNTKALEACLQAALNDQERRHRVVDKLETEGRCEAMMTAVFGVQIDVLGLRPWECPPSHLETDYDDFPKILSDPERADHEIVWLTTLLIIHGVSVYSPDPIAELKAAVKRAPRGRPPRC
jgi:hypothetical protein